MTRRKKLIEVALPLKKINEESAREKSIRHGHPSTLHLWWARRPLAACRAVLFAQLVDDPSSDPAYLRPDGSVDEDRAGIKRAELFNLIEELVRWENSDNPDVINRARAEIARCVASRKIELGELKKETIIYGRGEGKEHPDGPLPNDGRYTAWQVNCRLAPAEAVNHFLERYAPPVLDPFAGGGSIPLEAQRLGLRAHASDLNPVPVLINKALIEIPPKFAGLPPVNPEWQKKSREEKTLQSSWQGARGLAEDVRWYGRWMRDEAEKRIGHLYPKVKITQEMVDDGRPEDLKPYLGQELTVIAWLWARTVASPDPSVGGNHVPLVRSFWLSKKKGKETYVQPVVDRKKGTYEFKVRVGKPADGFDPDKGTKLSRGASFQCIISGSPMEKSYIRNEFQEHRNSDTLLAIVCEGSSGRVYLSPTSEQEELARIPEPDNPPQETMPTDCKDIVSGRGYGITKWSQLFTPRQLTALTTFSDLVKEARQKVLEDAKKAGTLPDDDRPLHEGGGGPQAYADAVATYLGFAVDKSADYWSSLCSWHNSGEKMRNTFGRQAIPMVWDFAECNPYSDSTGNWMANIEWCVRVLRSLNLQTLGSGNQFDATSPTTYQSTPIISTDPPYYDNIGYADLSDFFYVWLRRSLREVYPDLLSTMLTPKADELIASPYRHNGDNRKAAEFFETGLGRAIRRWREHGHTDYPTTIFYAFKQAETDTSGTASTGWETFLTGVIEAGFTITATWPMRTELGNRMVGMGTNALASSVLLACVPREASAPLATRREFVTALKKELGDALRLLQSGSIAPVDLAQAAIGPGMAIFSRYAKVVESDGSPMTVRTALTLINQVLDEVLAEQEGEFNSDTRWAVAWFEQFGMEEGPFGVAETLSKAKNTSVQGLIEAGVVTSRGGKVQLRGRDELTDDWDPATDERLTEWEAVQYLIRALYRQGETGAADLLRKLGSDYGERARDLAYRLYAICERKGWSSEALAYNSLVIAWPEISRLATAGADMQKQENIFE
ncbi:MAG: DUF1156 domain-containing protein [Deltaproteobacteria bacterium]|nr:DUF1156 domain-containing protein [Deltaproteobacteria bacterium]